MSYEPFNSRGVHVAPTEAQLAEFSPAQRALYSSVAARADECARLESAIKQTEIELAEVVGLERELASIRDTRFKPVTFMDCWRATKSH
jgi:hypothetical protein